MSLGADHLILAFWALASGVGLWSLEPPKEHPKPHVRNESWPVTPVDFFILSKLETAAVAPSPVADKTTLLRRVTLDLTGLPPTPEEVASFLDDNGPGAWERVVDRLLASPHYGEKWGRHWLDQARYADSDGYRGDAFRPHAWRWRRWVIDALNRDMPFDQFTIEQIAGDLLPNARTDQKVATGFLRNTLTNHEGGTDPEQFRTEAVMDRANMVGTVWLGLTVGCAQCHDHKYDPITQRDYYRLFAFFNTSEEWTIDAPLAGETGPYLANLPRHEHRRRQLLEHNHVEPLQIEWERHLLDAAAQPGKWLDWDMAFDDVRTALSDGEKILRTPPANRTRRQQKEFTDYFLANYHRVITKERTAELKFDELRRELSQLDSQLPAFSEALIIREEAPTRATHILERGNFRNPGEKVQPGTPAVLPKLPDNPVPTRLELTQWLVSSENPLPARVTVNRIWQQYFGRGLVKTSENFGSQGSLPSHPELLDWLARDFVNNGWRMKRLHRLIVTSAVYRQTSKARPDVANQDPENALLSHQARVRLPAELIRDCALAASGLLDEQADGRSVTEGFQRGIYLRIHRNKLNPFLANFDAPSGYAPVCRRSVSTTALQALDLLNDPVFNSAAKALALRVTREESGHEERLRRAVLLTLGRLPSLEEIVDLTAYLNRQKQLLAAKPQSASAIVPSELTGQQSSIEIAAWAGLASVLLNLDEFMTRE